MQKCDSYISTSMCLMAVFISTFSFLFSRGDLPPKAIRHQKKLNTQQRAPQQENCQLLKAQRFNRQLVLNLRQETRPQRLTGHDRLPAFYFESFYLPQCPGLRVVNAVFVVDNFCETGRKTRVRAIS